MKFKSSDITELVEKLVSALPAGAKNLPNDLKVNLQQLVVAQLHKMDLVTRDEFDAQVKVLHRTREKLEALEKRLENQS